MHIQSSQQNPSFVAELSQAVAGRLGQVEARQVATPGRRNNWPSARKHRRARACSPAWGCPRASLRGDHRVAGQTAGEPCPRRHPGAALPSGRAACRQSLCRRDQADDAAKGTAPDLGRTWQGERAGDFDSGETGEGSHAPGQRRRRSALAGHRPGRDSRWQPDRSFPYPGCPPARTERWGIALQQWGPRAVPPASMYSAQARSNCAKSPSNCMR